MIFPNKVLDDLCCSRKPPDCDRGWGRLYLTRLYQRRDWQILMGLLGTDLYFQSQSGSGCLHQPGGGCCGQLAPELCLWSFNPDWSPGPHPGWEEIKKKAGGWLTQKDPEFKKTMDSNCKVPDSCLIVAQRKCVKSEETQSLDTFREIEIIFHHFNHWLSNSKNCNIIMVKSNINLE